jgi:putative spermidine/putrescine transport system substrate-binding protein
MTRGRVRALVAAIGGLAALSLAACSVNTGSSGSSSGKGGSQSITVTAFAGAWGTLFQSSFIKPFEQSTGIHVNVVTGADATWLTQLRAAGGKNPPFDVLALTSESVLPAVDGKLIQPLDTSQITAWSQLDPTLVGQSTVNGADYGVPLTTGSLGWLYRTDKISNPPKDWTDIFNPAYCGHIALPPLTYNAGLEFFSALVKSEGGTLSDTAAVNRAFAKLETLKHCVTAYPADAGSVATDISNGQAWIVPYWDGRAFAMAGSGQPIGFVYPTSGAVGALTSYYVAAGTTKTAAVYKFLNYVASAQYQKPFAEGTFYGGGNDTIDYSADFNSKIRHGAAVYKTFTWVDYSVATPNLTAWQERWNEIFS